MKFFLRKVVFLLILGFPSIVLGKAFTNCGGDFSLFLKEAEEQATKLGVNREVLRKTIRQTKYKKKKKKGNKKKKKKKKKKIK